MAQIKHETVQVLSNVPAGTGYYRIRLSCHQEYARARPGQFVMVRFPQQIDPLLPRPFSIHRLIKHAGDTTGLELLYKVVGKGTHTLSLKQPGDYLSLTGPLGRGFGVPADAEHIKIVAGGIGVAPMIFLLDYLIEKEHDLAGIEVFLGGRSETDLLCLDEFSAFGLPVHMTTDDGSSGDQCLVTDPLEIAVLESRPDIIFACGPMEMLACVAGIADKAGIACQVSIEAMMACGMGACLGCAVAGRKSADKYLHVCLNGPVFDTRELKI
ncbi:MAG: dihydroorotate dehydrogenase electron transfer subunit [Desulfobacterales bacterium]